MGGAGATPNGTVDPAAVRVNAPRTVTLMGPSWFSVVDGRDRR